ncbi:MAG: hypothetical protein AAGB51_04365 [Planctomycetota bacterium]
MTMTPEHRPEDTRLEGLLDDLGSLDRAEPGPGFEQRLLSATEPPTRRLVFPLRPWWLGASCIGAGMAAALLLVATTPQPVVTEPSSIEQGVVAAGDEPTDTELLEAFGLSSEFDTELVLIQASLVDLETTDLEAGWTFGEESL